MDTADSRWRLPHLRTRWHGSRLWREWCFLHVVWQRFRLNFLLLAVILLGGGALFKVLEPQRHHPLARAMYCTWSLIFGNAAEEFPESPILQFLYFAVPLLGLLVILEGLVDFALMLRDRQRHHRSWCTLMAASLSNHIILVGLGKLGYRTFRLLRQLGQAVVVIERNSANQFLEDIRREGSPLFIGDARREAFLEEANAAQAQSIVLATNDDLANLEIALDARRLNPHIRVVLRMFDQNMADKVQQGFNIQCAMSQSAISAPAFVTAALDDRVVNSLMVDEQLLVIQRWQVRDADPLCGKTVAEALAASGVYILQRRVPGSPPQLMPGPTVRLSAGDELLVQGTSEALAGLRRLSAGPPPR